MICELEQVESLPLPFTGEGRSEGMHVSAIIRCLAAESGILKREYCDDLSLVDYRDLNSLPIEVLLRIHLGLAWESYYLPLLEPQGVIKHPGEVCVDDIFMTPDGESVDSLLIDRIKNKRYYYTRIHEVKCTYKSTNTVRRMDNTGHKSPFMWLTQVKAYLRKTNSLNATFHVMFPCGDYKRPITPQLRRYYLEFTPREIKENWDMLLEYRDYRLALEADAKLSEPVSITDWAGVQDDEPDND